MHSRIASSISPPADAARVLEIDPGTLRRRELWSDLLNRERELVAELATVRGMIEEVERHE